MLLRSPPCSDSCEHTYWVDPLALPPRLSLCRRHGSFRFGFSELEEKLGKTTTAPYGARLAAHPCLDGSEMLWLPLTHQHSPYHFPSPTAVLCRCPGPPAAFNPSSKCSCCRRCHPSPRASGGAPSSHLTLWFFCLWWCFMS